MEIENIEVNISQFYATDLDHFLLQIGIEAEKRKVQEQMTRHLATQVCDS